MTSSVAKPANKWIWTVKKGNNQEVTIAACLAVQDKWLAIIQDTVDQLLKAQEKGALSASRDSTTQRGDLQSAFVM